MSKERWKKPNEALNKPHKLVQRWNKRLTLDYLALAERYLKDELRVHMHLRHRVIANLSSYPEEFCAIFQRKLPVSGADSYGHFEFLGDGQLGKQIADVIEGAGEVENDALICHAYGHQELVLVSNVKLMEPPKLVVRSLVRLGSLDDVHSRLRRSLYLPGRSGFKSIGEGAGALEHGLVQRAS